MALTLSNNSAYNATVLGAAGTLTLTSNPGGRFTLTGNTLSSTNVFAGDAVTITETVGGVATPYVFVVSPVSGALTISGTPAAASTGLSTTFVPVIAGGAPPYTLRAVGNPPAGRAVQGLAVVGAYLSSGPSVYALEVSDSAGATARLTVSENVAGSDFRYPALFNAKASNTAKIRAGMAAVIAGDRSASFGVWAPSTGAGQSTGAGSAQAVIAWPMQLATMLQAAGINAGANGAFGDKGSWGGTQGIAATLAGDARLAITGGTSIGGTQAFGGNAFLFAAAAGRLSFTPQNPVTRFEIAWRDNATARSFNAAVDAGTPTLIATTGTAALRRTVLPAASLGTHTVNMDWVSGNVTVIGVHAYNDANGRKEISILNGGISGAPSARFNDETDGAVGLTATLATYQFDAAFYDDAQINDWRTSVSVASSKANATAWVQKVKAANTDPILVTPLWDGGTLGLSAQQDSYAAMLFEVATEQDVPLIDIRAAWQSYAIANAKGWYSDSVHPTPLGYAAKAAMMQNALAAIGRIR